MSIWYGANVADETELRLCGDLAGKRVIELGIAATPHNTTPNAVVLAMSGAKAIALDPQASAIASLRTAADQHEVKVECHHADLADLGFATSGSVDLVLASHTLGTIDDLPRLLRQVHRVLKVGSSFVVAAPHPVAAMFLSGHTAQYAYGATTPTIGDLYMAFERSNFHLDVIHELADRRTREPVAPAVLVVRARKQGN